MLAWLTVISVPVDAYHETLLPIFLLHPVTPFLSTVSEYQGRSAPPDTCGLLDVPVHAHRTKPFL